MKAAFSPSGYLRFWLTPVSLIKMCKLFSLSHFNEILVKGNENKQT